MGCGQKLTIWVLWSFLLRAEAQIVPCYFIFGDSLADNGNNNDVFTDAKANFAPYGVDLPNVPKGRFTNGRTAADIIGQLLGFDEFIPPFRTARGDEVLKGVNYASGGAGIRDETGNRRGVTSLRKQVLNHNSTIETITSKFGFTTPSYLNKCIYSVYIGSNDYINNYFKPNEYPTSQVFTPDEYARELVTEYSVHLQTLYDMGARKVALNGLGPLGCIPVRLNGTSCAEDINKASAIFNIVLKSLVYDLNRRLPDAKFTFIRGFPYTIASLLTGLPNYGPCCEVASGEDLCVPSGKVCVNRKLFLFWDAVHPAEATNLVTAKAAYIAQTLSDATPYGISHLATLI